MYDCNNGCANEMVALGQLKSFFLVFGLMPKAEDDGK